MNAKKTEGQEPGCTTDSKSLETFASAYLNSYREYISGKDMDEIHTPQFFKAYPFTTEIYALSNGAVCAVFNKGSRSKFTVVDGDFDDILSRVKDQNLDFMQVFPPFTSFTTEEAGRLARMDADRDLKSSRRLEVLTAAETHISSIHDDIQSVVDLNPWLDQQAAEQKMKLDKARELIMELYSEVDISREERFSDYMRQLSEVMAFQRGEMEEVTGEMELRMETAIEDMESRLSDFEKSVEAARKESVSGGKMNAGITELSRAMADVNARLGKMELQSSKDMGSSVEKLQSSFKELSKQVRDMEKEFKAIRADASEVKESVQRDSKRTYNLNERITDLERMTGDIKRDSGKDSMAAVRALEGRLNVMEKDMKGLSKKAAQYDALMEKPTVTESPVVETYETTPAGTTVKKTVKRTTTKKTTRSK